MIRSPTEMLIGLIQELFDAASKELFGWQPSLLRPDPQLRDMLFREGNRDRGHVRNIPRPNGNYQRPESLMVNYTPSGGGAVSVA